VSYIEVPVAFDVLDAAVCEILGRLQPMGGRAVREVAAAGRVIYRLQPVFADDHTDLGRVTVRKLAAARSMLGFEEVYLTDIARRDGTAAEIAAIALLTDRDEQDRADARLSEAIRAERDADYKARRAFLERVSDYCLACLRREAIWPAAVAPETPAASAGGNVRETAAVPATPDTAGDVREKAGAGLPPVTDEIDQFILRLVTADPDLSDSQVAAQLPHRNKENLPFSRQAINERRKKLKAMGYKVR
jgi:hypothetical protein